MKAQGLVRQSAAALVLVLAIMVGGPFAIGPDTSAKGFPSAVYPVSTRSRQTPVPRSGIDPFMPEQGSQLLDHF